MRVTRGFKGKSRPHDPRGNRIPPGQYLERDFPVLTAGPTPHTPLERWSLSLEHHDRTYATWSWTELLALPQTELQADIHCVTKWTRLDTRWRGVTFDDLARAAGLQVFPTQFVMAHCDGGYTTNVPLADLVEGKSMIATHVDGAPLTAAHGGPARLVVPHLYFWKSAKWIRRLELIETDRPGFWESLGYHIHGDPWREQRYTGDR